MDARTFDRFDQAWIRMRTTVVARDGQSYQALSLHRPEVGETVVELDNYGLPLAVSDAGVALIDRIEQEWPARQLDRVDREILAAESAELRYLLLSRLVGEATPAAEVFHVLAWSDVDAVAAATLLRLQGQPAQHVPELGHLLTPAVVGVTGPLEQLHEGLATADSDLVRRGGSGFCQGLLAVDVARIPTASRELLSDLATAVGDANPFVRHTASIAAARLGGEPSTSFTANFTADLPDAAATHSVRFANWQFADASPLSVWAQVDQAGSLSISVNYSVPGGSERDRVLRNYAGMFQPITVVTEQQRHRYWVALSIRQRRVSGTINLIPEGTFRIEADSVPVDTTELRTISPAELEPSVFATDNEGLEVWRAQADQLPVRHPIRLAFEATGRSR
jgi:hypothetical protein